MSTNIFDDPSFHRHLASSILLLAPVVWMIFIVFQPSTYGKLSTSPTPTTTTTRKNNTKKNWFGPMIPAKWAWMIFESPNWIISVICFGRRQEELPWPNFLLLCWFVLHYIHRSILYPLKMSNQSKFPIGIMFLAAPYCVINGYLQAQDLVRFRKFPPNHVMSTNFILGTILMLAGFAIAYHSDATLIHLKKSTGTYQIPQGGLFQYVSCPHFLGEILEWTGFCIASNFSWATLSFLVWTSCNLIPRALAQDEWYHATFPEEYKKLERRAIVPYLL